MSYINPKSVTFWSGVGMLVVAVARSVIEKTPDLEGILSALGLIGLRKAIK